MQHKLLDSVTYSNPYLLLLTVVWPHWLATSSTDQPQPWPWLSTVALSQSALPRYVNDHEHFLAIVSPQRASHCSRYPHPRLSHSCFLHSPCLWLTLLRSLLAFMLSRSPADCKYLRKSHSPASLRPDKCWTQQALSKYWRLTDEW